MAIKKKLMNDRSLETTKKNINKLGTEYYSVKNKNRIQKQTAQYSGIIFNDKEINAIINTLLDGWFGHAKKNVAFESELKKYLDTGHMFFVKSGSSANLLAISFLVATGLLSTGDEIIVCASSFPTTVNPIIQNGLVPVFVDCIPTTYNIDPEKVERAISSKTKAIFVIHTLGNPCNIDPIGETAQEHDLLLIEDCCDALGAQ